MGQVDDIRVQALACVTLPEQEQHQLDPEYGLRRLYRWFSREFHLPLPEVEQLPLAYLLQHYYESVYENMEPPELEQERIELTETPEEKVARESGDEVWLKEAEEEAARLAKRAQRRIREGSLGAGEMPAGAPLSSAPRRMSSDATLPTPVVSTAPIVQMRFEDAALFEEILETGFGPPPKK